MVTISRTTTFALAALPCSRARMAGLFAAGVLAAGCTQVEKLEDDGGSGNAGIPTEVQRAFDESCAISSCHDSAARQGGLDLSATAAPGIIGGQSSQSDLPLVELGNVQGSYLAVKMLPNPPAGSQMPIGVPPGVDNPTNIAIILGWIAGAPLPGGGGGEGGSTTEAPVDTTTDAPAESTGEPEVKLCGLEDVAPGEPNPFDIGMNAGQIPPDVGEASVVEVSVDTSAGEEPHPARRASASQISGLCIAATIPENDPRAGGPMAPSAKAGPSAPPRRRTTTSRAAADGPARTREFALRRYVPVIVTGTSSTLLS